MKVENYGNGKFTVSQISDSDVGTSTKITIYARVSLNIVIHVKFDCLHVQQD